MLLTFINEVFIETQVVDKFDNCVLVFYATVLRLECEMFQYDRDKLFN